MPAPKKDSQSTTEHPDERSIMVIRHITNQTKGGGKGGREDKRYKVR